MQFDPQKLNQELEPRTAKVAVNELRSLYETEDRGLATETEDRRRATEDLSSGHQSAVPGHQSAVEDIIVKVRGLNGNDLAAIAAKRDTNAFVEMLSEALVTKNGKDGGAAIKGLLGLFDDELHPELKYHVEIVVRGSIDPKIDYPLAVKLARDFYVVLRRLSEKILELSGQGAQLKKKPGLSTVEGSNTSSITTPSS